MPRKKKYVGHIRLEEKDYSKEPRYDYYSQSVNIRKTPNQLYLDYLDNWVPKWEKLIDEVIFWELKAESTALAVEEYHRMVMVLFRKDNYLIPIWFVEYKPEYSLPTSITHDDIRKIIIGSIDDNNFEFGNIGKFHIGNNIPIRLIKDYWEDADTLHNGASILYHFDVAHKLDDDDPESYFHHYVDEQELTILDPKNYLNKLESNIINYSGIDYSLYSNWTNGSTLPSMIESSDKLNHYRALGIKDNSNATRGVAYTTIKGGTQGNIDFDLWCSDVTPESFIFLGQGWANTLYIRINNDNLEIRNQLGNFLVVMAVVDNTWYHIHLEFNVNDIDQKYDIYVDDVWKGRWQWYGTLTEVSHLQFETKDADTGYNFYIDNMFVSWDRKFFKYNNDELYNATQNHMGWLELYCYGSPYTDEIFITKENIHDCFIRISEGLTHNREMMVNQNLIWDLHKEEEILVFKKTDVSEDPAWFKGQFPATKNFSMRFWAGYSWYIPDNLVICEGMQRNIDDKIEKGYDQYFILKTRSRLWLGFTPKFLYFVLRKVDVGAYGKAVEYKQVPLSRALAIEIIKSVKRSAPGAEQPNLLAQIGKTQKYLGFYGIDIIDSPAKGSKVAKAIQYEIDTQITDDLFNLLKGGL